jgi:hypothetical protein
MTRKSRSRLTIAADVVLAAGGLACLLALVYFLHQDGWAADQQRASAIGSIVRYGMPAIVSLFLFGGLLLRPRVRENLALLSFSTALALFCAELVLLNLKPGNVTLWTPATQEDINELVRLARGFGVEYDTRTQLQVVRDLRMQGVGPVPAVYPFGLFVRQPDGSMRSLVTVNNAEALALSGISNSLTVFCNEAGHWVTYQSDEHGFNNPPGIWGSDAVDIVVLGDSFAQGACVPADRNFAAVIRARYPATLNLGYSNKGPLMSLGDLKEYVTAFRPRIVLWFFYEENDFGDLKRESASPLLMQYLDRDFAQGLSHHQADLDNALEQHWVGALGKAQTRWPDNARPNILGVMRLNGMRRSLRLMGRPHDRRVELEQSIGLLADVFAEAKQTVDSWGGQFYLVYLPERQRFVDPRAARLDETKRRRVLNLARSLGVDFIDISAAFQSSGDPLGLFPFRRRGHYNEAGHRLVAETVLQTISTAANDLDAEAG